MGVLLGGIIIVCIFIAAVATMAAGFASIMWLWQRIKLIPYFRMSELMYTWYRREQDKDWCTRCGQRVAFGIAFLVVQLPFFLLIPQRGVPARTFTLVFAGALFIRAAWGRWFGGEKQKMQRAELAAADAHAAFDRVTPTTGAQARVILMDILAAERVVRYSVYTLIATVFLAALARDAGARSVLDMLVLR